MRVQCPFSSGKKSLSKFFVLPYFFQKNTSGSFIYLNASLNIDFFNKQQGK